MTSAVYLFAAALPAFLLGGCTTEANRGTGPGTSSTGGTGGGSGGSDAGMAAVSGAGGNASAGGVSGSAGDANTAGTTGGADAGGDSGHEPPSQLQSCELQFPYRTEAGLGAWLGGDSNFSLVLSPTRALMTFQDTFVGNVGAMSRSGAGFIANTVAVITCDAGQYGIGYFWRRNGSSNRPVFTDTHPSGDRLWVHRPWLHGGKLFLTATRVGEGGALGFEEHGMTLARVDNPLDPPNTWNVEYFNLTDQRATVGKGMVVDGDYVYLFTPGGSNMALTRVQLAKLLEPTITEASLEYLAKNGAWKPGLDLADTKSLGIAANTGLTVRYHPASSQWLALYLTTSRWPSADIAISSAPSLEGPWSTAQVVYSVPEMDPGAPEYEQDTFCYGAAEQVAFNPDPRGRLLFTYTCNSSVLSKQVNNLDIYLPIVADVVNPLGV